MDHHIEIVNHDRDSSNVDLHETAIFQFPMPSGKAVKRPLKSGNIMKKKEVLYFLFGHISPAYQPALACHTSRINVKLK